VALTKTFRGDQEAADAVNEAAAPGNSKRGNAIEK